MNCWPWGDPDDAPERRRWRESMGIVAACLLGSFLLGVIATALALIYMAPGLQQAGCCT